MKAGQAHRFSSRQVRPPLAWALAASLSLLAGAAAAAGAAGPATPAAAGDRPGIIEVTAETTDPPLRRYHDAFSRKLVSGGEADFPKVAGKPIYGRASVAVTVRATGEVEKVEVLQASSRDLSQHAVRLVKQMQPFGPFPPDLRARASQLVLVAHLNYVRAGRAQRR
jgi:TonB family protein